MIEKSRTSLTLAEVRIALKKMKVYPLTQEVVFTAANYSSLEIHDRLILATAHEIGADIAAD